MPDSINFIFCFQSKSEKELLNILKRDNFNNSVFIDKESKLDSIYHFSRDLNYQCFLLNKENEIVLVGNPALNPQIWDLYRKFWIPMPNLEVGAGAWILAGGTHHSCFSYDLTAEYWEDYAEIAGIEMVHINKDTTISCFKKELRMNEVYYMLNKALC